MIILNLISLPVKAPEGAVLRAESAMDFLARVKRFNEEWVLTGHVSGQNAHNVSATVNIKPDEWDDVGSWMWNNRNSFNGLSVLPYNGGNYVQAPFEDCTEKEYRGMCRKLIDIDLTAISEEMDNTSIKESLACAGGACEVTNF